VVDKAIRDVKAVRTSHPQQQVTLQRESEQDEQGSAEDDPFANFRIQVAPPSLVTHTTLEDGSSYAQVPSRYATLHNMVSVYTEVVKLDAGLGDIQSGGDTRYGTTGRPPPDAVPRFN
jgi:hypothetical protein